MSGRQFVRAAGVTALALAVVTPASAVVAPQDRPAPIRPAVVEPTLDAAEQAAIAAGSTAWQQFAGEFGQQWSLQWEPRSRTVTFLQGSGIDLLAPGSHDVTELRNRLGEFLSGHADLFGVAPSDLVFSEQSNFHGKQRELGIANFTQVHQGVPVHSSIVSLRVKFGRLVQAAARTFPNVDVSVTPALVAADAAALAGADARSFAVDARPAGDPELVVYPIGRDNGFDFVLAWSLEVETSEPAGRWSYFIDAHTGVVVERSDRVHFVSDGQVTGAISSRWVLDPIITVPMEGLDVNVGGDVVTTDANGNYSSGLNGTQSRTVQAKGPLVNVVNNGGSDGVLSLTGSGTVDLGMDAPEFRLDERTAAHTVVQTNNVVRQTLNFNWLDTTLRTNVNVGSFFLSCNATWDGNAINFYPGSNCGNTGEFVDVIAHEWGHGLDDNDGNGIRDSGFSEGNSDVVGSIMTGDCRLSPGFLGDTALRDNCVLCPQSDCAGGLFLPHLTGQQYASAMWCTRENLITKMGEAAGIAKWTELALLGLPSVTSMNNTYNSVLLADDDDGNLANGTPNLCEINPCWVGIEREAPDASCAGISAAVDAASTCNPGPFATPGNVPVTLEATNVSGASATVAANVTLVMSDGSQTPLLNRNITVGAGAQLSGNLNVSLPAGTPAGTHFVALTLQDAAGNLSESTSCSFITE